MEVETKTEEEEEESRWKEEVIRDTSIIHILDVTSSKTTNIYILHIFILLSFQSDFRPPLRSERFLATSLSWGSII